MKVKLLDLDGLDVSVKLTAVVVIFTTKSKLGQIKLSTIDDASHSGLRPSRLASGAGHKGHKLQGIRNDPGLKICYPKTDGKRVCRHKRQAIALDITITKESERL